MISTEELRDKVATLGSNYLTDKEWIEVIDRLEVVEKSDAESLMMYRKARDERDALRARIEAMEQQEPVGVVWRTDNGHLHGSCNRSMSVGTSLYARPLPPAPSMPDDVVEQAVNRFLSWKLPKDFRPDGGVVFIPTKGRGYDSPHWPCGTNLLNAQQAREMLRYVLAAAPEAKP